MSSKKNDPNTIFIRYSPPISSLTRQHLESVCSDIGPVKKCSLIRKRKQPQNENNDRAAAGFAFVKFTSELDAKEAVEKLNNKTIYLYENTGVLKDRAGHGTVNVRLMVDLASDEGKGKDAKEHEKEETIEKMKQPNLQTKQDEMLLKRKRNARVILRNLSFYASSRDVQKVMEKEFGPVMDINLPLTPGKKTHRGFAFVTFENVNHAKKAVDKGTLIIKKRSVAIDYSVSKMQHQRMQKEDSVQENDAEDEVDKKSDDDSSDQSDSESESSHSDEEFENKNAIENENEGNEEDEGDNESQQTSATKTSSPKVDTGVHQQRTLFLRNLPYDCSRHSIFQLFSPYGTISSIYLVKDRNTGMLKGTAFLEYKHSSFARAAMEASGCESLNDTKNSSSSKDLLYQTSSTDDGIQLQGRRIFINYAVDKQTAESLTVDAEQKKIGKDKRNLYLKNEGRVGAEEGWEDDLLDSDRDKRGRAHNEKSQKLRSPLFFINPLRLSIRNLAKHISDESQLRTLIVEGLTKGLERNLVSKEDIWLQERAKGEHIPRSKMLSMEIPIFDPKQLKQSIPSIFIDKDQLTSSSKGFAFVEFTHHAHALACLRQLNNNPMYSREYAAGGKRAAQGNGEKKVPRLIVEFTVENKAKAKQQADRRARQLENATNQKFEKAKKNKDTHDKDLQTSKKKKMSRGALQREKKRKLREEQRNEKSEPEIHTMIEENNQNKKKAKVKMSKPLKKQKVDKEEKAFESMVARYKSKFMGMVPNEKKQSKKGEKRRWFE